MSSSHRLGEQGEELARVYLEMQGFRLVQGRFRLPGGEIDLIMREGRVVVFVEVKTRSGGAPCPPEECVTVRQLGRLRRAAAAWLTQSRTWGTPCRFDVVAVELEKSGQGAAIRHYRQVV